MTVLSVQTTVTGDESGHSRNLAVSLTGEVTAKAYKPSSLQVAIDAYSTDFETHVENASVSVERLVDKYVSPVSLKSTLPLGDTQLAEVIDIWPAAVNCESHIGESAVSVKAMVDVSVLGKDTEGQVVYTEGQVPFETMFEMGTEINEGHSEGNLKIKSASFILQDSSNLEVRFEAQWEARVFDIAKCQAISSIEVDAQMPKTQATACALTIYFADEGESVWEVAKHYNTRPDDIKQENDLAGDILSEGMILIPSIR